MINSAGSHTGGTKNILVVDDTGNVADLMREMLLSFGYQVQVCLKVEDALASYAPDKFDLVITDYLMPRMNGVELAEAIKQRSAAQRILLITGSTFPMSERATRPLPVNSTLQKPFSVAEFQQAVAALLTTKTAQIVPHWPAQTDASRHDRRNQP